MKTNELEIIAKAGRKEYRYYFNEELGEFLPWKKEQKNSDAKETLTFQTLDFATMSAISDKVAEIVVTQEGGYHPEFEELLIAFYLLKLSAGVNLKEFDAEEVYRYVLSPVGTLLQEGMKIIPFMKKLRIWCECKVDERLQGYLRKRDNLDVLLGVTAEKMRELDADSMGRMLKRPGQESTVANAEAEEEVME